MTPERFRQVRNLFDAALDREPPSRARYLAEACEGDEPLRLEIERLLAAHLQPSTLLDAPADRPLILQGDPGRMEGKRIGPYEILRELGRGGMGTVYRAARIDGVYRKPVALKLVRAETGSAEVIERFRREREILASLDHPNLARLLDGGTTEQGLPYFVMDYVEGRPIDAHCDERRMNVAERLKLFRTVCGAVEYAHSRGVVHRDLKPANILVTADGTVKLLDFGIAKLLRSAAEDETTLQMTRAGMLLMTPEYASPEQVRGESVGPASDIYSLGVILYELLTGYRPYRMRSRLMHEVVRVISEEEPQKPSAAVTSTGQRRAPGDEAAPAVTPQSVSLARASSPEGLRRQLSGDPDKIVLKTLRKEPAARYRSAAALGEDIGKHLEGLPVLARGQGPIYSAWKVVVRQRAWVLAALVLATALATGAVKVSFGISTELRWALVSAVVAALFGFWLATKDLGAEQASRRLFPVAVLVFGGAVLAWAIVRSYGPLTTSLLTVVFSIWAIVQIRMLTRWRARERWAGALLLDVSPLENRAAVIPAALLALSAIAQLALSVARHMLALREHRSLHPELEYDVAYIVFLASLVGILLLQRTMELRGRGLVLGGSLIPWSSIASYAWEAAKGDLCVLRVRRKERLNPLNFFGARLPVPARHKEAADAILARQLSEWPSN